MINLQQLDQLAQAANIDLWEGITVPSECVKLDPNIIKSVCFERCGLNIPIYPDPDTFRAAVTLWARKNQYTFIHVDKIMAAEYSPIENVFEDKETTRKFDGTTDTTGHTDGSTSGGQGGTTGETLSNDVTTLAHGKKNELTHGKKTELTHGKKTTEGGNDQNNTTNTISAYDSNTYQPDNKSDNIITYGHTSTDSGTDTSADSGTDTSTDSGTDTTTRNYSKTESRNLTSSGTNEQDTTGQEIKDDLEKITESRHGNIGITSANKLQIEEYNMLAAFNPYNFIATLFENELTLYIY